MEVWLGSESIRYVVVGRCVARYLCDCKLSFPCSGCIALDCDLRQRKRACVSVRHRMLDAIAMCHFGVIDFLRHGVHTVFTSVMPAVLHDVAA